MIEIIQNALVTKQGMGSGAFTINGQKIENKRQEQQLSSMAIAKCSGFVLFSNFVLRGMGGSLDLSCCTRV